MFDMISVCIALQNNMHPKGTEIPIFEEFKIVKNEILCLMDATKGL